VSRQKRVLLFDVKLFKYNLNKIFLFVFFYKFRTTRRKEIRPVLSTVKQGLIPLKRKALTMAIKSNFFTTTKKSYFFKAKIV
jgi:hypothetical protein